MKNLTEIQIKILKALLELDPEFYYSYNWIDVYADIKTLKKEMKGLLDLGIVEFKRGLMNDDGEVAGSGFQIFYSKRQEVEEFVSTQSAEEAGR